MPNERGAAAKAWKALDNLNRPEPMANPTEEEHARWLAQTADVTKVTAELWEEIVNNMPKSLPEYARIAIIGRARAEEERAEKWAARLEDSRARLEILKAREDERSITGAWEAYAPRTDVVCTLCHPEPCIDAADHSLIPPDEAAAINLTVVGLVAVAEVPEEDFPEDAPVDGMTLAEALAGGPTEEALEAIVAGLMAMSPPPPEALTWDLPLPDETIRRINVPPPADSSEEALCGQVLRGDGGQGELGVCNLPRGHQPDHWDPLRKKSWSDGPTL